VGTSQFIVVFESRGRMELSRAARTCFGRVDRHPGTRAARHWPIWPVARRRWPAALALALLAAAPLLVLAQSASSSFQIPRQSIDGGAALASSASFTLSGSIGQPEAGPMMTSAGYALRGGFHVATSAEASDTLFSNGFEAP